MAEAIRTGRALRSYQVALVLLLGWGAGRVPQWLDAGMAEQEMLAEAMGGVYGPVARASTGAAPDVDTAQLAAEVAARVAAQVADETIARLIAAGWAPAGAGRAGDPVVQRIVLEGGRVAPPPETVVRLVVEPQPGLVDMRYDLPPGERPKGDAVAAGGTQPTAAKSMAPKAPPLAGAAAPAAKPASAEAHATATSGYAALARGDRAQGVRLLRAAGAIDPDAPEAAAWAAEVQQQTRRWSVAAYTLAREGSGEALAAAPVLGGGQAGAAVAYRLNPLAERRVSIVGRVTAAAGPEGGIDGQTSEAAIGLRLEPSRKLPVALDVERRIALGLFGRNAWAARISGGSQGEFDVRGARLRLEGYGEAGVVEGFTDTPDLYAGGQFRGGVPLFTLGSSSFDGGAGAWAGVQRSFGVTASRVDLGPSVRIRVLPWPFYAQLDYRARVTGNALPGSGPVLTVIGEF